MQYTTITYPKTSPSLPLIYRWEIIDNTGRLFAVYIGKSTTPTKRPIPRYPDNVHDLLNGKPTALSGGQFRAIHAALAVATLKGYTIILSLLTNVHEPEEINALEADWQKKANSHGPDCHQTNNLSAAAWCIRYGINFSKLQQGVVP